MFVGPLSTRSTSMKLCRQHNICPEGGCLCGPRAAQGLEGGGAGQIFASLRVQISNFADNIRFRS